MSLFYPHIDQPLTGPAAFAEISETAAQPQAAILLLLARQLRHDDAVALARAHSAGAQGRVDILGLDSQAEFPVPTLGRPTTIYQSTELSANARSRYGFGPRRGETVKRDAYARAGDELYSNPSLDVAAGLMEMCLSHPRELVRIAAASAYFPITDHPRRCLSVLERGLASDDLLERDLAATALARIAPELPRLRRLTGGRQTRSPRDRSGTITLVHGTWARNADWYQPPSGDFFKYIASIRSDLYGANDFFRWSGGYSDAARDLGAVDLRQWVIDHNEAGLDLMGHSHGANVMNRATQLGLQAGRLVLLSCPVHVNKYLPDFANLTGSVDSVRVKMDLVILADGGGQRFQHPQIMEVVLPIWFDHGATHEPSVWMAHNIAQTIGL